MYYLKVLIPLLVDDPLWADENEETNNVYFVLIPLLVDDPLWAEYITGLPKLRVKS